MINTVLKLEIQTASKFSIEHKDVILTYKFVTRTLTTISYKFINAEANDISIESYAHKSFSQITHMSHSQSCKYNLKSRVMLRFF